jgi:hypothetical protein
MGNDTTEKTKPLPSKLRAETLTKLSLSCRFRWHEWVCGEVVDGGHFQFKTCMKCGRTKRVGTW